MRASESGTLTDHGSFPVYTWTTQGEPLWAYARLPREVIGDPELKLLDIRVYCMLAGSVWQGNTARIGTRLLASYVRASRRLVVESLQRLEKRGHLEKAARHGQRQMYVLTSPVFGQKQRAGMEEVISSPSRTPRLASVRRD